MNQATEKILSVPGISCGHCKRAIDDALSTLAGVDKVDVSIDSKTVNISYDGTDATLAAVVAALDEQGYDVAS